MKKIILIIILIFPLFNMNQMYWDRQKEREDAAIEKLTFDIAEFIVDHKNGLKKQGYKLTDVCWTSYGRIGTRYLASYRFKLIAGKTYIAYTYTTGQAVRVHWKKDNYSFSEVGESGNKIIHYYTAPSTGDYHYYVRSTGADEGIHVSYVIQIKKN